MGKNGAVGWQGTSVVDCASCHIGCLYRSSTASSFLIAVSTSAPSSGRTMADHPSASRTGKTSLAATSSVPQTATPKVAGVASHKRTTIPNVYTTTRRSVSPLSSSSDGF
jgi:hypothetical protein